MEKLIITSALTGAITVPTQTPHLPFTPEDIAADAVACAEAGAAAIHIHARDPENGKPSSDPEIVMEIAGKIKSGTDAIVGITTGGGMGMTPEEAIVASTINAAFAIGLQDRVGSIEVGKQADIIILDVPNYMHLPYHFGVNNVETVIKKGKVVVG